MKRKLMSARVLSSACVLLCWFVAVCVAHGAIPVFVSDDGVLILATNDSYHGLVLINADSGESVIVTDGHNAGYYATISPDSRYVCFKGFKKAAGGLLQAPMLYDIEKKEIVAMSTWAAEAGTPAVSPNGKIAFTVGKILKVLNADMSAAGQFDLGHYVNIVVISPDGSKIAFTDKEEQVAVISLADGKVQMVSDGKNAFWGPKFSPLGDKVLASTVGGAVVCADLKSGTFKSFSRGEAAAWIDNDTIAFVEKTVKAAKVTHSALSSVAASGVTKTVTTLASGDATAVINRDNIVWSFGGKLKRGIIDHGFPAWLEDISEPTGLGSAVIPTAAVEVAPQATTVQISGVPYIHQVYDTLDTFCGSWACGATSALMAIQYYNILPAEPRNVSYPYAHVSPYGFYISEIYTYNGHTYNVGSDDCWGQTAYGGYGYIVQHNWEDTKGHMAEYISYHGPTSSVDWSPTFAKAQGEVNNSHPFVLLNSLTASGHYITCIGYYTAQYTLIFNDPYGNKNTPGYPSYDGAGASYDWPGYNYGNQNLNTVWCFIYCRQALTPTPTPTPTPSPTLTPTPTPTPTPSPTPTPTLTPTPTPTPMPTPTPRGKVTSIILL